MSNMHVDDIGNTVTVTVAENGTGIDVSAATTKQIIFSKADGTAVAKTASFVTDGTNGQIRYTIASNDLSVAGPWKYQGRVAGSGFDYHTDWGYFEVSANLPTS